MWKILQRKKNGTPISIESVTYSMLLPSLTTPTNSHLPWHIQGTDVLHQKSSTELNDEKDPRWHILFALSPEAHAEWGLYKILKYMGLHEILPPGVGQNRTKLKKDIEEYHLAYNIDFEAGDLETCISRRNHMHS